MRRLVSLGSPHIAPPPGANDATRGALKWVDERWPGAYFSGGGEVGDEDEDDEEEKGIQYACVTGRTVRGKEGPEAKGTLAGYSCNSYIQVCGKGRAHRLFTPRL